MSQWCTETGSQGLTLSLIVPLGSCVSLAAAAQTNLERHLPAAGGVDSMVRSASGREPGRPPALSALTGMGIQENYYSSFKAGNRFRLVENESYLSSHRVLPQRGWAADTQVAGLMVNGQQIHQASPTSSQNHDQSRRITKE